MINKKNRKGFMKILEAFTAIMLITFILLIIINRNSENRDISQIVYNSQYSILRQIQLNDSMRGQILGVSIPEGGVAHENLPTNVKNKIESDTPVSLICEGMICDIDDDCILNLEEDKSIYVQSTFISADGSIYSPRKLNLFCWAK